LAKQISDDALAAIEDAARRNPGGASAQQIMCALAAPIPLRTLQHRVKSLVTRNRLFMDGEGRWARYRMPGAAALATSDVVAREEAEDRAIPLSEAGISIRNYVRQALEARRPVGYDRKFLDQYRPNVSFYLTGQDRARLAAARDIVGRMVAASDKQTSGVSAVLLPKRGARERARRRWRNPNVPSAAARVAPVIAPRMVVASAGKILGGFATIY